MDYTSKEDEELFRATTPMTRMIKISPYDYADKDAMPEYTEKEIASRYSKNTETTEGNLTWKEFLELGKRLYMKIIWLKEIQTDRYLEHIQVDLPEFQNWSSIPSANVVAVAFQMSIFIPPSDVQEKWWLPILPPALIAVTVSMTLFPMSAGLNVVLDPFCPSGRH